MSIGVSNRLYKIANRVYFGTTEINVHNQRGRLFIKHRNKQINIKNIPTLPKESEWDLFQWYVLDGLFQKFSCPVIDWWMAMRKKGTYIIFHHNKKQTL